MVEPKLNLNIILKGRVMFSKEECLKITHFKVKNNNKYKIVAIEDKDKYDESKVSVFDSKGRKKEIISIYTRKHKEAHQSININKASYLYMVSKDSCLPYYSIKDWNRMNKKERLEAHLKDICEALGGISYNYQVFED